jgi:hypothetical protein
LKTKIKIKCFCATNIDVYQYHVLIYDSHNCLVFDNFTDMCKVFFNAFVGEVYKIIAINNNCLYPKRIIKKVCIRKNVDSIFFVFNNFCQCKKEHKIVCQITDKYYEGLPIMKGEIDLWNI